MVWLHCYYFHNEMDIVTVSPCLRVLPYEHRIYNNSCKPYIVNRDRICKRLWSPGIDSWESILPAYVAWRASTTNRVFVPARQAGNRFLCTLKGLQIRAQKQKQLDILCWLCIVQGYSSFLIPCDNSVQSTV
jgi:hypothetical protein